MDFASALRQATGQAGVALPNHLTPMRVTTSERTLPPPRRTRFLLAQPPASDMPPNMATYFRASAAIWRGCPGR